MRARLKCCRRTTSAVASRMAVSGSGISSIGQVKNRTSSVQQPAISSSSADGAMSASGPASVVKTA
jgi:hypothetical protein